VTEALLEESAARWAQSLAWLPGTKVSQHFAERLQSLRQKLQTILAAAQTVFRECSLDYDSRCWLHENLRSLRATLSELEEAEAEGGLARLPHVRMPRRMIAPRVIAVAEDLLASTGYRFSPAAFSAYLKAFQHTTVLHLGELWGLVPALKLVLLERAAGLVLPEAGGSCPPQQAKVGLAGGPADRLSSLGQVRPFDPLPEKEDSGKRHILEITLCLRSLDEIKQTSWKELLEPLIAFDEVLRRDPAQVYTRMDSASRENYREAVVQLAGHSDCSEIEIAGCALELAQESLRSPASDPRLARRQAHIGYYLLAEGREALCLRAGVRLPWHERGQAFLRRYPDEFYLAGIELLTLGFVLGVLWWANLESLWGALFAAAVVVLPCSQAAVEIMNYLATSWLHPRPHPKLDFRAGIPDDCTTMVVVPALLINEKQVRQLVRGLEVRYVGNMSANLHFALLTDLADSAEQPREDDPLVELCGELIRELNRKYPARPAAVSRETVRYRRAESVEVAGSPFHPHAGAGTFAMFHRHRVYNPREGVWMGWERKRGKLLDFNKLVLGQSDSFPYKVGDLSILPRIRYVLTLDADTELPRGSAQRLIGTLAHPLCQAIVDERRNIVTRGYGILQPRVGVSVQSVAQSRLASIYSGRTGFDVYTRATSDVYQDLYGEGSFVGKGLYEVGTMHRVLDHRFPRNSILSHDLIEGAYLRAGLISDIELIDRYPSHYSAHTQRRHRWMRGDWQIAEWLFAKVRDESGRRVPNPISLISRWKILDNLRRSMVEPAMVALFLLGWTVLPGSPLYWTLVALGVLLLPPLVQFAAGLVRAAVRGGGFAAVRGACGTLATAIVSLLLTLVFLLHGALVCTDAIWRSLYRRLISRQRLLEWETAAEAELGSGKRTPVDLYLTITPLLALAAAMVVFLVRRPALPLALPILCLWGCSPLISSWLDRPPGSMRHASSPNDELFLRRLALRTWRYFAQWSTEEHNWLVPDNVQESPEKVAARVSPTNIGLLLNARQAAWKLGYLTAPEFVEQTRRTLDTMARLSTFRGHLKNWYDTRTLAPLESFVSSVDSGNLAASLIALQNGCLTMLGQPVLSSALLEGYGDVCWDLLKSRALSRRRWRAFCQSEGRPLLERLPALDRALPGSGRGSETVESEWSRAQLRERRQAIQAMIGDYAPWLLPQFEAVRSRLGGSFAADAEGLTWGKLPAYIRNLCVRLEEALLHLGPEVESERETYRHLLDLLAAAQRRSLILVQELRRIAADAERWWTNMDFRFLFDRRRQFLSIGYTIQTATLHGGGYDLLASEARMAYFIAIAKGDLPQDVWLRLGRKMVPAKGGAALVSWTGTMFEYLMPALWMRTYPDTLLHSSMAAAVREQRAYAARRHVPWGISESGYSELDDLGNYHYHAFGVPSLALAEGGPQRLVIAPYATVLALAVDAAAALKNLRRMARLRWFGPCGFYEAADIEAAPGGPRAERAPIVRSWMAHHQGMSLLSLANSLHHGVVQEWFHAEPRVEATELLLQERPPVYPFRKGIRHKPSSEERLRRDIAAGDELALAG
jgi:hypothetical protein